MDQTPTSAEADPDKAAPSASGGGLRAQPGERLTADPAQARRGVYRAWFALIAAALGLHAMIVVLLLAIEQRRDAKPSPPEAIPVEVVAAAPHPPEKKPSGAGEAEKANSPRKGDDPAQSAAKREPAEAKPRAPPPSPPPNPPPEQKAERPAKPKEEPAKQPEAQAKAEPPKPPPAPAKASTSKPPEPPKSTAAAKAPTPPEAAGAEKTAAAARPMGGPGASPAGTQPPASRLPFDLGPPIFRAVAVPLPVEGGDEPMNYKVIVFGMLERVKHFPDAAAARGARGSSVIEFSLDERGGVENVALVRSSGDPDLDAESLAVVTRAAPFPVPPPGGQRAFAAEITFGRPN